MSQWENICKLTTSCWTLASAPCWATNKWRFSACIYGDRCLPISNIDPFYPASFLRRSDRRASRRAMGGQPAEKQRLRLRDGLRMEDESHSSSAPAEAFRE